MSVSAFLLWGCARPVPTLIIPPVPIGDGGRLIRELYRSTWVPPAGDDGLIRVGLVPSQSTIRFRALADMRIRAYSESDSWEVASPEHVKWRVEAGPLVRPPIVNHFPTVKQALLPADQRAPSAELLLWRGRGYPAARWVGPSSLENRAPREPLERWFLALTGPTTRENADRVCSKARERFKGGCQVVSRIELPPIFQGTLTAENSTFSKTFRGFLEILSPKAPVELFDFVPEERTNERTKEQYGPRLFVLPNSDGALSLVQSTSLGNYLEGVVASEIYPEAPAEALAAQAVVARTYALRFFHPEETGRPFTICASTNCQVYRGVTYKRPGPSRAVAETAGLVLFEPTGGFAETFYHSICGGHTEPRQAIWGASNRGYLVGVPDETDDHLFTPLQSDAQVAAYLDAPATSFCGTASMVKADRWRWTADFSSSAVDDLARSVGLNPPLTDIVVKKRGISGRALEVEFRNSSAAKTVGNELKIRQLFGGLLSSLFVLDTQKKDGRIDEIRIHGAGYGHGVGLCQLGSIGRAEAGQTFQQILQAYYPGTRLAPVGKGVVP